MKSNEVHKLSVEELRHEAKNLRKQLFDLRTQAVTEKLENPRQLRNLRRDIARVLTEQKLRSAKESA
jgi:large subunit ribosomal protein L29